MHVQAGTLPSPKGTMAAFTRGSLPARASLRQELVSDNRTPAYGWGSSLVPAPAPKASHGGVESLQSFVAPRPLKVASQSAGRNPARTPQSSPRKSLLLPKDFPDGCYRPLRVSLRVSCELRVHFLTSLHDQCKDCIQKPKGFFTQA